jgi:hypothetical protein
MKNACLPVSVTQQEDSTQQWSIIDDNKIVIPISIRDGRHVQRHYTWIDGRQVTHRFFSSRVELVDHFPAESMFSITVHNIHDLAINRCILNLLKYLIPSACIGWEGLYVTFSSVRYWEPICLLVYNKDRPITNSVMVLRKSHLINKRLL